MQAGLLGFRMICLFSMEPRIAKDIPTIPLLAKLMIQMSYAVVVVKLKLECVQPLPWNLQVY